VPTIIVPDVEIEWWARYRTRCAPGGFAHPTHLKPQPL
jgi:hypothetical protein